MPARRFALGRPERRAAPAEVAAPTSRALPAAAVVAVSASAVLALFALAGGASAVALGWAASCVGLVGGALTGLHLGLRTTGLHTIGRRKRLAARAVERAEDAAPAARPARELSVDGGALRLEVDGVPVLSLDLDDDVGVLLLSNRRRSRVVAALTSPRQTLLVGTELGAGPSPVRALLPRATVLSDDEPALDAVGPDGGAVVLDPALFVDLLEAVESRAPASRDRLVLSDQRGERILLDDTQLGTRLGRIDLSRPLEWRPILFQESFGHAVSLYQGTWVRQAGTELVLVSILTPSFLELSGRPSEPPRSSQPPPAELDRLASRDRRLLQAAPADPPPAEQRVALDGLFVVPLRAALEQAPRASSQRGAARHA